MYYFKNMNFKNYVIFYIIQLELKLLQVLKNFWLLQIEINIYSGSIIINKIKYEKIKYLIFVKFISNII